MSMRLLRRFQPSPALVIACVALAIALGGTSYAAIQRLPKDSVTTYQVKRQPGSASFVIDVGAPEPTIAADRSVGPR